MQKTAHAHYAAWWRQKWVNQMLLVMKLTIVLLTIGFLQVHATVISQTVTISGENITLQTVFNAIKNQTGYHVFGDKVLFKNAKLVSVNAVNMELESFLKLIFRDQPLDYQIKDKIVIVSGRKPKGGSAIYVSPSLETPPITVHGRIVNEKGEVIPVTVIVKGTEIGATTDAYGNFELNNVDENATIVISGVSIEKQEIKINGRKEIDVTVVTKISSEQEVIIYTNYFSTTKRNAVSNISRVNAKDIEKQPVTTPLMSLQGRMPGVDIAPEANYTPGGAVKIQIRGLNSLRTGGRRGEGNLPLYVIDGVPVESRSVQSASNSIFAAGYDPLSAINPASIESIQVLKDAAATAIYGSRGANGVVLITTKSGTRSARTDFNVSMYTGAAQIANRVDVLSVEQYLAMRHEAFANDEVMPGDRDFDVNGTWDTTRRTDWQKELLQGTGQLFDAQMDLSGGNDNTTFRISGGYHKESSPISNDFSFKRSNAGISVDHRSINKRLNVHASINYGATQSFLFSDGNLVPTAVRLAPVAPSLYDVNGNLNWEIDTVGSALQNTWTNPLSFLKITNRSSLNTIVGSGVASYHIIGGLSLKTNIGFTQLNSNDNNQTPISSRSPTAITATTKGQSIFGNNRRTSWIIEPQAIYNKGFGKNNLEIIAGTTYQLSEYNTELITANGYASDGLLNSLQGATSYVTNADNYQYKYIAVYGNIKFERDQKYFISVSGRRDGSSRFGPNYQYGNFGAIGAGWVFTQEKFLANTTDVLSFGKLRGSYGITGNDQIGDYQFYNTYSIASLLYQGAISLYPTALYNPDFRWEATKKLEFGIELGFLRDRIGVEISWYKNRSSNQLLGLQTPGTTGFPDIFTNLNATVQNTGLECLLNTVNINWKNFKWTTSVNFTVPRNKLIAYPGLQTSPDATRYKVGEPLTIQSLLQYQGINPNTGLLEFKDVDSNNIINFFDAILTKPLQRNYYGGISNTFSFKNLELSFLFQFANTWSKGLKPELLPGTLNNQPIEVLDRWRKPGDESVYPKFSQIPLNAGTYRFQSLNSDANTEKVYYVRLKTLSLSYHLGNKLLQRSGFKDISCFVQGQNLLTFTNDPRIDPETGNGLPPLRMATIGLQFKL